MWRMGSVVDGTNKIVIFEVFSYYQQILQWIRKPFPFELILLKTILPFAALYPSHAQRHLMYFSIS